MACVLTMLSCFQTSEAGVTEHIEGDECKFAVWTGRAPMSDYKIVLKVHIFILI
jgi:triple functional domain protein